MSVRAIKNFLDMIGRFKDIPKEPQSLVKYGLPDDLDELPHFVPSVALHVLQHLGPDRDGGSSVSRCEERVLQSWTYNWRNDGTTKLQFCFSHARQVSLCPGLGLSDMYQTL